MVYSAIDVGSNTLRLLVAQAGGGDLQPLRYDRVITRLGSGVKKTGRLDDSASASSIAALSDFSREISSSGSEKTRAVGTSALRDAENAGDFISRVRAATGIGIEVITGEEEARLTALGVLSSIGQPESFMIADIGGGSTEIIYSQDGGLSPGHISEPIGAVNLLEAHLKSDPPSDDEILALKEHCQTAMKSIRSRMAGVSRVGAELFGTAGTASTLAAIDLGLEGYDAAKIHGHTISLDRLREMLEMLRKLPLEERARVRGLEPQRADLIIPGVTLTISLMETFGFLTITISDKGLLEGIVLDMAGEAAK